MPLILKSLDYTKLVNIAISSNDSWQKDLFTEIINPNSDLYNITNYNKYTNALAITICAQDIENIQYFLNYTYPDKVNVYGCRQIFNSVHLATLPHRHISTKYFDYSRYSFEKASLVFDILKYKEADFNFVPHGLYKYQPIEFGMPQYLKIQLIKHGANPFLSGTSYYISDNMNALKRLLAEPYDLIDKIDINLLQDQYNKMLIANLEDAEQLKQHISSELGRYDIFAENAIIGEINLVFPADIALEQKVIGENISFDEGNQVIFEPM